MRPTTHLVIDVFSAPQYTDGQIVPFIDTGRQAINTPDIGRLVGDTKTATWQDISIVSSTDSNTVLTVLSSQTLVLFRAAVGGGDYRGYQGYSLTAEARGWYSDLGIPWSATLLDPQRRPAFLNGEAQFVSNTPKLRTGKASKRVRLSTAFPPGVSGRENLEPGPYSTVRGYLILSGGVNAEQYPVGGEIERAARVHASQRITANHPTRPIRRPLCKVGRGAWIGIGGHLAVPPLPHHRAYGSRTTAVRLG
jgi:hypothetical protein